MARIGGRRWRRLVQRVLAEEGGICGLCGLPGANSGDHKTPVSIWPEGEFVRENVMATHLRCNQQRGTKPLRPSVAIKSNQAW